MTDNQINELIERCRDLQKLTDDAAKIIPELIGAIKDITEKHNKVTTMISRYLVASKGHVADSWLDAFIECGAVTIDTTYPTCFIAPVLQNLP